MIFLGRLQDQENVSVYEKHVKKLTSLYGADIIFKQPKNNILNLTHFEISPKLKLALSLGLNCHINTKFDLVKQQVEIEKLFTQIEDLERKG